MPGRPAARARGSDCGSVIPASYEYIMHAMIGARDRDTVGIVSPGYIMNKFIKGRGALPVSGFKCRHGLTVRATAADSRSAHPSLTRTQGTLDSHAQTARQKIGIPPHRPPTQTHHLIAKT